MIQRRFAGVVGFTAFFGNDRVSGAGQNNGAGKILVSEHPVRPLRQQIIADDVEQKRVRPLCFGEFGTWTGHGVNCSGVYDTVESPKLRDREIHSLGQTVGVPKVNPDVSNLLG